MTEFEEVYKAYFNDVFIYGTNPLPNGGTMILPQLFLGYHLILAILESLVFVGVLYVFRKKEIIRIWIERLLPLPVSYVLAHLCTKGFELQSYAAQRDFSLIVLIAILLYCVFLFGLNLYRMKRE